LRIIEEMNTRERIELIRLLVRQSEKRLDANEPVIVLPEHIYQLQSEVTAPPLTGINTDVEPQEETIVRYVDENPGDLKTLDSLQDSSFYEDYIPDNDLAKFLERPQLINTVVWAEGTQMAYNFSPWTLFFNSTQVKNKLDNYGRLSCKLHVKAIINASPFYYGATLVSYLPNPILTASTVNPNITANNDARIMAYTQRPHFWILPQTNQGGELELPFFWHQNWIPITTITQTNGMGTIFVNSPVALSNANSVVGSGVTVQFYAWATDVRLCGPTQTLALQADRSNTGLISGPASAVASVSRALERVPFLAPYAKATTMISSGVGSLAKLFGFTNVPNIEAVEAFKNLPFHSFASAEISQPIEKLTVDPKQELSIDPRTVGCEGKDELALKNLVTRDSFVCQSSWTAADATGTILFKANVTPHIMSKQTIGIFTYLQTTPMGYFAPLFKFWRGDIIYRFKIICSRFHRGRILIQWDPIPKATATVGDTNVIYSQIVDISEDTDVEFRVPYLGSVPFLRSTINSQASAGVTDNQFTPGTGTIPVGNGGTHNGQLTVSVLTQQTSPVSSADIYILGFARGADNMVFGCPQEVIRDLSFLQPQADRGVDHYGLSGSSPELPDEAFTVNMGERIVSVRSLMRRVNFSYSAIVDNSTNTKATLQMFDCRHAPIPLYRGYDNNGIHTAQSLVTPPNPIGYNFVENTIINYVLPCFIGFRGGINWHYNVLSKDFQGSMVASRYQTSQTSGDYYTTYTVASTSDSRSNVARNNQLFRLGANSGMSLLNQKTQTGMSVYYPMYTQYRMRNTEPAGNTLGKSVDSTDTDRCRFQTIIQPYLAADFVQVDFYCGIGTDFNCFFFLNTPTYTVFTSPAAL